MSAATHVFDQTMGLGADSEINRSVAALAERIGSWKGDAPRGPGLGLLKRRLTNLDRAICSTTLDWFNLSRSLIEILHDIAGMTVRDPDLDAKTKQLLERILASGKNLAENETRLSEMGRQIQVQLPHQGQYTAGDIEATCELCSTTARCVYGPHNPPEANVQLMRTLGLV